MKLEWDKTGQKLYETGTDRGVLYEPDQTGAYTNGVAWNGLTAVSESPSGAEATKLYADNTAYLTLTSAEEFGATLEAYTYPDAWTKYDGSVEVTAGVLVGQQPRKSFGLAYRTLIGNDLQGTEHGYKIHLVYNCLAAPSEKSYATVNDSPEAVTFSYEITTTPVSAGAGVKPTATITIDSTKVDATALAEFEDILYGTSGSNPTLPVPATVIAHFANTVVTVTPTAPTMTGDDITIPSITGVVYSIDGDAVTGTVTITEDTIVVANPEPGYVFSSPVDTDWFFQF
jgi:hypothetical protein